MSHANPGKLLKNTIFLYLRMFLVLGVSLYTSRVVINALGIEDYGIYTVVAGTVTLISFLNTAMAAGTQRFLSFELGNYNFNESRIVFTSALLIHLGISILIFIIAETFGFWIVNDVLTIPEARMEAANWIFQCAVAGLMVNVMQVPYTAVILSHERMDVYAYMSFIDVGSKLAIVFALGIEGFDPLKLYATMLLATAVLVTSVYAIYCHKTFAECRITRRVSFSRMREMGSFVGWNLTVHIASVLNTQGVNILLNIYFGPAINAARGVAVQAAGTLQGFVGNVQAASAPQIIKTYAAGEIGKEKRLIIFSCKITLLLMFLMALPVFLESRTVLSLWLGTPPADAADFMRLIIINAIITTSANPMFQAISATGRIKRYQSTCSAVLLAGVLLGWLLLHLGSPASVVFIITIGVSIIFFRMQLEFLNKNIGFSPQDHFRLVIIPGMKVMMAGAVVPIVIFFTVPETIFRFIYITLATIGITPFAILWFGLEKNEVQFLRAKFVSTLSKHSKTY